MSIDRIPVELRGLTQWVCARRDNKAPMMSHAYIPASSSNPDSWSSFEEASGAVKSGAYDNVGFVFNDNGIVGIDIDDGYDEDGFISPLAADIIAACKSYTERSRSGRGFHILVRGDISFKGKNNRNGVEIYKTARYFIMTGDIVAYDTIVDNQEAIDYVVEKYFPEMREVDGERVIAPKIYTPVWEKPMTDGRIKLRPVYPRIPDGCRNICLTSLAGMLHNQGYPPRAIYEELIYCNNVACDPVLHDEEVASIVNSVTRYKR